MKKKNIIAICAVLLMVVAIIAIVTLADRKEDVHIFENEKFSFDKMSFDDGVEVLLKRRKDVILHEERQGVWEQEDIYSRTFTWEDLGYSVTAYYYFDEGGFERGIYEIVFSQEQKDDMFEKLYDALCPVLKEADTYTGWAYGYPQGFEQKFHYRLTESLKALGGKAGVFGSGEEPYAEIRMKDEYGGIFLINHYNAIREGELQCVIELEICPAVEFAGDIGQNNWPSDARVSWDVEEKAGEELEMSDAEYRKVRILRFAGEGFWAMGGENGECIWYDIAPDCRINGLLNPSQFCRVTYEDMVAYELSSEMRNLWSVGVDESGRVVDIVQCMEP